MKDFPRIDTYRFYQGEKSNVVQVFNQNSYLMAEYNKLTGATVWRRVLDVKQRTALEKRLQEQFPPGKAA